jgi:hypothetical protein
MVPFDPPELTMDAAIRRGWELDDDDQLLVPKQEEYLPTYPVDRPWEFAPARIPWRDDWRWSMERRESAHGPFIVGLPEV